MGSHLFALRASFKSGDFEFRQGTFWARTGAYTPPRTPVLGRPQDGWLLGPRALEEYVRILARKVTTSEVKSALLKQALSSFYCFVVPRTSFLVTMFLFFLI